MTIPVNPDSNVILVADRILPRVVEEDATYWYVAEAESPNTPTTTAKWRNYRVNKTTWKTELAQLSGVATDRFVFTGVTTDMTAQTYGV